MNNDNEENGSMPEVKTETPHPVPRKREKKASYVVLRLAEDGHWKALTKTPIPAVSRRAALVESTKAEEEKGGTFLVLPEAEYKPIKRKVEIQTVDKFE